MAGIKLSVNRLQTGLYIKLPLKWGEHPFMLSSFKLKSEQQIRLIKKLGLSYVLIFPEKSDTQPLPMSAPPAKDDNSRAENINEFKSQLENEKNKKIDELKNYRRGLQKTEGEFNRSLAQVRAVMAKVTSRPLNAVQEATELVDGIVEQLMSGDNAILHLMNDKKEGDDLYYHYLNVSILSMILAKSCEFNEVDMRSIGIGALFHDIGKLKVPSQILRKKTALSQAESNYLKQHPKYCIDLLAHAPEFSEKAKRIALQHHEMMDGSGYPSGLKGNQIDSLAQLVALVNSYDAICHPQDIKKAKIPFIAISHLFKNCKDKYNNDYLSALIKILGIYPPGSVVQLSSGQVGMVLSVNSKRLLYPNVLIYDPSVPKTEAPVIDLEDVGLTIEKAVAPTALPEPVFEYLSPRSRISYYFDPSK